MTVTSVRMRRKRPHPTPCCSAAVPTGKSRAPQSCQRRDVPSQRPFTHGHHQALLARAAAT